LSDAELLRHVQGLTVGDISREHRRRFADRVAAVCGHERFTYRELDERVNRLSQVLADRGCGDGSVVVWFGQNCHRVLEHFLACAKLGATLCPINWRASVDEAALMLRDLSPAVVVWQRKGLGEKVDQVRRSVGAGAGALVDASWIQHDTEDADGYEALLAGADDVDDERFVDCLSPVLAIYTGAFSGAPNAALLNHVALSMRGLCEALWNGIDHDYVYLNNGPMFHVGNWRTMMPTYLLGGKNVFVAEGEPEALCGLIEAEGCIGAYLAPGTRERLNEANADGRFDLTTLRVSPGVAGLGYGQTETGGMATTTLFGPPAQGAAGRALPLVQVRVFDAADQEVGVGETGEIVARGMTITNGYLNRDDLNRERFRNEWWHTGDLGRREADGSLTFVGPKTRMLKSGYENIYPTEVEQCLASHPAISEAAVIGVPDPKWVQSVKAIVVVAAGQSVTEASLIDYCRQQIAGYKKPRRVEFVEALPRHGGLVDYDRLDEVFGGGGYPSLDSSIPPSVPSPPPETDQ
jgi:acyl-CoA synthetase (AMP-forming)/AMP-acid ligase II